jgi:hypothetical protein
MCYAKVAANGTELRNHYSDTAVLCGSHQDAALHLLYRAVYYIQGENERTKPSEATDVQIPC